MECKPTRMTIGKRCTSRFAADLRVAGVFHEVADLADDPYHTLQVT